MIASQISFFQNSYSYLQIEKKKWINKHLFSSIKSKEKKLGNFGNSFPRFINFVSRNYFRGRKMKITSGNRCHGMFYLAGMQVQLSHNCFNRLPSSTHDRSNGESTMSRDAIQRKSPSEIVARSSGGGTRVAPREKGTRRLQNILEIRDDWLLIQ